MCKDSPPSGISVMEVLRSCWVVLSTTHCLCWPRRSPDLRLPPALFAADLPVREVILYKHGVGFFERSGELKPGETARLDFKAGDMNDVLKSLTITDRNGGKIGGVRYDASESLEKRLEDFPFALGQQASLAAFLDQMKGAELEIKLGTETITGTIAGSRGRGRRATAASRFSTKP